MQKNNGNNRNNSNSEIPSLESIDKLDQQTALQILIQSVHIAQSRGTWSISECVSLNKAINAFVQQDDIKTDDKDE